MQKQLAFKIFIILVIGASILIPLHMVKSKVYERQDYLQQAKHAVAKSWTGAQTITTPVIVIPYQKKADGIINPQTGFHNKQQEPPSNHVHIIMPDNVKGSVDVENSSVFKGIYEIPIYKSKIKASGEFSEKKLQQALSKVKNTPYFYRLGTPYISLHISDVRGIDNAPVLHLNNKAIHLNPGSKIASLNSGLSSNLENLEEQKQAIQFELEVSLRGMSSISFITPADNAKMDIQSNWPHPEFIGASLPSKRQISKEGFGASWSSTRYSNNILSALYACLENDSCYEVKNLSSGVNFIEPVDIYLQSQRSIKYAMLFIGLSFITFFIFEHIKQTRIHPIQYAFVGLATAVFYLLLISLAEHIAFHLAYGIAVLCCSSLLLFYVRHMLKNFSSALLFCVMITLLYSLLYVIIQAEDFALLMGSLLVFIILSALMMITRKIDWYQLPVPTLHTEALNNGEK